MWKVYTCTRTFNVKGMYLKADIEETVYMILVPKFNNNEQNKYDHLVKSDFLSIDLPQLPL